MAINMRIEVTSGVAATAVPDDAAEDFQAAYDALKGLPVNRQATTDPFTPEGYAGPAKIDGKEVTDAQKSAWNARLWVRQGKAWAAAQTVTVPESTDKDGKVTPEYESPLVFARKGDVKGNPTVVSFKIYVPRKGDDVEVTDETPDTETK
jgi:hypothetical protein